MGVRKNFGYNLILTFCNYLFPLITYPYVTRVLGVDNIGICNIMDNLVNYAVIVANLGITVYGVREIARCGDDRKQYTAVFSNLFIINLLFTALAVAALLAAAFLVPSLLPYREFVAVGVMKLVFNLFLIEWFFQGLQQFKFISLRAIAVRFLYTLAVLLLVRDKDDTLLYFFLMCATVAVNAILDWGYSKRFVRIDLKSLDLRHYMAPVLVFGAYMILTNMYTSFNTIYLGMACGDTEAGYFGVATKLQTIIMAVFTAFTTVMVPRVSYLLKQGEMEHLQNITNSIFDALCALSLPVIVLCLFCAPQMVHLIAGPGYEGAIPAFRIVIFLLLVIGMEQIVIGQFLLSSQSNKAVLMVCSTGAIVGISCNLAMTASLGATGSALSWGLAELAVLLAGLVLLHRTLSISIDFRILLRNCMYALVYALSVAALMAVRNVWLRLGLASAVVGIEFVAVNFLFMKEGLLMTTARGLLDKIRTSAE